MNSTIALSFTTLTPRDPASDKSMIDGEILVARILFVLICMVAVIPSLINPFGFSTSASTLKLLVDGVALLETKLKRLLISSPVTSCIDTFWPLTIVFIFASGTSAMKVTGSSSIITAQISPLLI